MKRRSSQTVMYEILNAVIKLMAPILPFTAEELWNFMPAFREKEKSIHLASLPEVREEWKDAELSKEWEYLIQIRGEVTKALEEARAKKLVGHSLDSSIIISVNSDVFDLLNSYADEMRGIFIVSKFALAQKDDDSSDKSSYVSEEMEGLSILVMPAPGEKCERCWIYDISVGQHADHPTVCGRCCDSLEKMGY